MDEIELLPRTDPKVPIGSLWYSKEPLYVRSAPRSWGARAFSTSILVGGETVLVLSVGVDPDYSSHVWIRIVTQQGSVGYLNRTHFNSGGAMERV